MVYNKKGAAMKNTGVLIIFAAVLTMCLQSLSWAQEGDTLKPYQGAYQVGVHCTLRDKDWYEENHSIVMNVETVNENQRIYKFYLPLHEINDYVEIKFNINDTFNIAHQQFASNSDQTNITHISGYGTLKNDSIYMQYHLANTYAYGALICDGKGRRSKTAIEQIFTESSSSWQLSPQPAGEVVQAVCTSSDAMWQKGRWFLHDLSGRRLQSGEFTDGRFEVSLRSVPHGMYMIEIRAAQGNAVCRLKCIKGR